MFVLRIDVLLEDIEQLFTIVVKVQPRLATAYAKLFTHVLSILNHALGDYRQRRQSETPNSLLKAFKFLYILPALLHSQDGRVRRERFTAVERGDITRLLPWLMRYKTAGHRRNVVTQPTKQRTKRSSKGHHQHATTRGG